MGEAVTWCVCFFVSEEIWLLLGPSDLRNDGQKREARLLAEADSTVMDNEFIHHRRGEREKERGKSRGHEVVR